MLLESLENDQSYIRIDDYLVNPKTNSTVEVFDICFFPICLCSHFWRRNIIFGRLLKDRSLVFLDIDVMTIDVSWE